VFGPEEIPRDYATRACALLGLRPSAWLAACADLQAVPERLPQLQLRYHELRIPVSVLCGKDDCILDWREQGRGLVDQVRGARLELIEGGHMLPVTNPVACAAFVERAAGALRHAAQQRTA
jgi:pimeloyl-ACP methyl ester carboxylesterase